MMVEARTSTAAEVDEDPAFEFLLMVRAAGHAFSLVGMSLVVLGLGLRVNLGPRAAQHGGRGVLVALVLAVLIGHVLDILVRGSQQVIDRLTVPPCRGVTPATPLS